MYKLISIILFILSINVNAQDFHWTQFQSTPFYVNPAFTGLFEAEHLRKTLRASLNYRQQWRTIRSDYSTGATPFSTYSFAIDGNISNLPFMGQDVLGLGITVYKDEAGDLNFSTNKVNLYLAYHKAIQQREDRYISLGMNYGFANNYVDFSKASFDSQWNGTQYVPGSSTGENINFNSKGYQDFSVGLSHFLVPHYGTQMRTGISAQHLNRPSQSFYNNESPLSINWVFSHDMVIPAWRKWSILPSILYMHQKPATECVIFSGFRLNSTQDEYQQFGIGYRITGNYKSPIHHDALYLTYKLGVNNWTWGFSYDTNVSMLSDATSSLGAFEIAIVYHGRPFNKPRSKHHRSKNKCPEVHPVKKKFTN